MTNRWDETWHRLREWTNGQAPAERLAAQVLLADGFSSLDPSHPLGGPDRGKDALLTKDGASWVMAVYFPRGKQRFTDVKEKFLADHEGVGANNASGMAFVTNQELALDERKQLQHSVTTPVEIFHIERVTAILDQPAMHGVRAQFLQILAAAPAAAVSPTTARPRVLLSTGWSTTGCCCCASWPFRRPPACATPTPAIRAPRSPPSGQESWLPAGCLASACWRAVSRRAGSRSGRTSGGRGGRSRRTTPSRAHPSAAASFITRGGVLCVDRTWTTRIDDDAGEFAFYAAREPEVAAELLVSLGVAGWLLAGLPGLNRGRRRRPDRSGAIWNHVGVI